MAGAAHSASTVPGCAGCSTDFVIHSSFSAGDLRPSPPSHVSHIFGEVFCRGGLRDPYTPEFAMEAHRLPDADDFDAVPCLGDQESFVDQSFTQRLGQL